MSITKSHLPNDNRPDYMVELGLAPPYTQADVMQAYYAKAKKVHPDHGGTAEEFRALQEAFAPGTMPATKSSTTELPDMTP